MVEYLYTARQVYALYAAHGIAGVLPKKGKSVVLPPGYVGAGKTVVSTSDKRGTYGDKLYSVQCYREDEEVRDE